MQSDRCEITEFFYYVQLEKYETHGTKKKIDVVQTIHPKIHVFFQHLTSCRRPLVTNALMSPVPVCFLSDLTRFSFAGRNR